MHLYYAALGYSEEQIASISKASAGCNLRSANMSLGVNVLLKLVADAAKSSCRFRI